MTARSFAKLVEKHAEEAEQIAIKLQATEGIIASLNDHFMKLYQADTPLEPAAPSENATTHLNFLNSSPAASSTGRDARPTPPEGPPPQRGQWHAKAPLSSLPPPSLAGPPLGAARQHHNHQGTPGTGQPLTSKARTAHDFLDHAGEQLVPSVAEALRRITVFWEQYYETHFFVQYDASSTLQGFDYLQLGTTGLRLPSAHRRWTTLAPPHAGQCGAGPLAL